MPTRPAGVESFGLPPIPGWLRNLLIALFAMYVVELLVNTVVPLYAALAWFDLSVAPWQILTRYLVQGPSVLRVVFDLLILYSIVPKVFVRLGWAETNRAVVAVAIGGTLLAGILGAIGFAAPPGLGWHGLSIGALTVFGLLNPDATVLFSFIFPVSGRVIALGTGVLCGLILLASPTMVSAEDLGSWLGIMAWYHSVGPGGRRRQLIAKSKNIERDLRKFSVLQGGKNSGTDETYH